MKTGIELITEEKKLIEKEIMEHKPGWSSFKYNNIENIILVATIYTNLSLNKGNVEYTEDYIQDLKENYWPWDYESFPSTEDRKKNLIRAGALITEVLDRLELIENE